MEYKLVVKDARPSVDGVKTTSARFFKSFQYLVLDGPDHRTIVLSGPNKTGAQLAASWARTWMHRLGALTAWALLLSYVSLDRGIVGEALELTGTGRASLEGPALLILAAFCLAPLPFLGARDWSIALAYVLFLPFGIPIWVALKVWDAGATINAVMRMLGSVSFLGANWLVLVAACMVLNRAENKPVLWGCVVILGLIASYSALASFVWASSVFSSVRDMFEWIGRVATTASREKIEKLTKQKAAYAAAPKHKKAAIGQEAVSAFSDHLKNMNNAEKARSFISKLSGSKVVLFYAFAARFLLVVAATVTAYAGVYRGIAKIEPGAFSGGAFSSFWHAFYYSVVTFFTVGDGAIAPVSQLAQLAIVGQIVTALLVVTVLVLSFSTVSTEVSAENINQIVRFFDDYLQISRTELATAMGFRVDAMPVVSDEKSVAKLLRRRLAKSPEAGETSEQTIGEKDEQDEDGAE